MEKLKELENFLHFLPGEAVIEKNKEINIEKIAKDNNKKLNKKRKRNKTKNEKDNQQNKNENSDKKKN